MTITTFLHGAAMPETVNEVGEVTVWKDSLGYLHEATQVRQYTEVRTVAGVQGVRAGDFLMQGERGMIMVARELWTLTPATVAEVEAETLPPPPPPPRLPAPLQPEDIPPTWRMQRFKSGELKQMCRDAHIHDAGTRLDLMARLRRYGDGTETSAY